MPKNIVDLRPEPAGKMSGLELPHASTEVWAIDIRPSRTTKAHFWRRVGYGYQSICRPSASATIPAFLWNGQNPLFAPGDYPKCKRCMDALRREGAN